MRGKFIVFEGSEGGGKTTQLQRIQAWLQGLVKQGIIPAVVVTRQPGGTALGVHLRSCLLGGVGEEAIAHRAELLLYAADRAQHIEQVIEPNLAQGAIILCDRYTDSTIAYQGYGRGLDLSLIEQINAIATNGLESDLTLWLNLDVELGLARTQKRVNTNGKTTLPDRIEQETITFHRRVQQGYIELAKSYPHRIVNIDATPTPDTVQTQIQAILTSKLQTWGYIK